VKRTARLSDQQWQEMTDTRDVHPLKEYGAMAEVLLDLYSVTAIQSI